MSDPATPTAAAVRLVELIATAGGAHLTPFEAMMVDTARKLSADLRRERDGTSRSGIPLTRKAGMSDTINVNSKSAMLAAKGEHIE